MTKIKQIDMNYNLFAVIYNDFKVPYYAFGLRLKTLFADCLMINNNPKLF